MSEVLPCNAGILNSKLCQKDCLVQQHVIRAKIITNLNTNNMLILNVQMICKAKTSYLENDKRSYTYN